MRVVEAPAQLTEAVAAARRTIVVAQPIKTLGARRWQALHRSVYAAAALAILHFFWMRAGKNDFAEVAVYAVLLALLLGWRLRQWLRKRRSTPQTAISP